MINKQTSTVFKAFVIGCVVFGFMAASQQTSAQSPATSVEFTDPWIRGSVPGQKNGAAYTTIKNGSAEPVAIVSGTSDRADRIELHTIIREDGVAKMREVQQIDVPALGLVKLEPGGFHIMFIGLEKPFVAGETVPVTVRLSNGQTQVVNFMVKPATHMAPKKSMHSH